MEPADRRETEIAFEEKRWRPASCARTGGSLSVVPRDEGERHLLGEGGADLDLDGFENGGWDRARRVPDVLRGRPIHGAVVHRAEDLMALSFPLQAGQVGGHGGDLVAQAL